MRLRVIVEHDVLGRTMFVEDRRTHPRQASNHPVGEFGDVRVSIGDGDGAAQRTALQSTRPITGS